MRGLRKEPAEAAPAATGGAVAAAGGATAAAATEADGRKSTCQALFQINSKRI
jgi:hypothetical protein